MRQRREKKREKARKHTKSRQNPKFDCHSCNPEFVSKHQKYQNSPMPNPAFSNFQIVIRQQSSFQTPLIINLDTKFKSRHRYLYLFGQPPVLQKHCKDHISKVKHHQTVNSAFSNCFHILTKSSKIHEIHRLKCTHFTPDSF